MIARHAIGALGAAFGVAALATYVTIDRRSSAVSASTPNARAAANARTGGAVPIATELVATVPGFPVYATFAPGDYTRLFVVVKSGTIRIVNLKTGQVNPNPFLSVSVIDGSERGLLGLAFHPEYQTNGLFYIYANVEGPAPSDQSEVQRFQVSADPDIADATSGQVVISIGQPESNHNGGWIGFGPDGMLRITLGDGGGTGDQHGTIGNGQALDTLHGKILRLDVDADDFPADPDRNYAIPPDNPFVADPNALDEIWVYGIRNAWRSSFDRETGDFFIGDVGASTWEEISLIPAGTGGQNLGWRCYEGDHDFIIEVNCAVIEHHAPLREYRSSDGQCAIAGGFRYRGCAIPGLEGEYFFGDYCIGRIYSFGTLAGALDDYVDRTAELAPPAGSGLAIDRVPAFGEDARGEIYICDWDGQIYRIIPVTPTISDADINCSGAVDVFDLLAMLASWGPCDGCAADFGGDHQVSVTDLLQLLAEWG